jgi:hypothetical protein
MELSVRARQDCILLTQSTDAIASVLAGSPARKVFSGLYRMTMDSKQTLYRRDSAYTHTYISNLEMKCDGWEGLPIEHRTYRGAVPL